jgi:molecular chaperone HscA
LTKAREAKEALTKHPETAITAVLSTGQIVDLILTSLSFAGMTENLVNKTLSPTRKAMRDAGLGIEDIKGVVMVGGSTRMPHVRRAVGEFFLQEPLTNLDPDKVVAIGASIQANILAGNRSADEMLLLDVIPLSLGIETMGGITEKIIPRNSTIPAARAQKFTTFKDGQTAMMIHVLQGERELVSDCRSLAKFELRGIPPMVAGAARILVTFQVDADGLLSVSAREQSTDVETRVEVKPSYGLSDGEITRMLQESYLHAQEDMAARTLREQQTEGNRLLEATEAAVAENGAALLTPKGRADINLAMATLRETIAGDNYRAIKMAAESLNLVTSDFAARRMDMSVRLALSGHRLEEIAASL